MEAFKGVTGNNKYQNNTCEVDCDEINEHFGNIGQKNSNTFTKKNL